MQNHLTGMKVSALSIIVIVVPLFFGFACFSADMDVARILPLPMAEVDGILSRWLTNSGFEISRPLIEGGQVLLRASREYESLEIILKPHSPLACSMLARYSPKQPDQTRLETLWAYLENYLTDLSPEEKRMDRPIPDAVRSQSESVVCIKAMRGSEPIQFSGFIIDVKGDIISIAHDLKGVQEVAVILSNGQELQGRLVRRDAEHDLTLIRVDSKFSSFISLTSKVRTRMDVGEKVYCAKCPINHERAISSGTIERRVKQPNGLPLWEVGMEILPGSSGSPVFDGQLNLVGVVKGRYRGTDSVGFLIPVDSIIEFLGKK
jgi:serine protease Do